MSLSLATLFCWAVVQINVPGSTQDQPPQNQPQPAATSDIQKLRDEIQLKAMQEVSDKISLVASDMYTEASKGNKNAASLDHPANQAAKLLPGGISGSIPLSWSENQKPSQQWMSIFANELDNWFPLFRQEMATVLIPDDKESAIGQDWSEIQTNVKEAEDMHQSLRTMSTTDPPNGPAIADTAQKLYYNMQEIKSKIEDVGQIVGATNTAQESASSNWKQVSTESDLSQAGDSASSQAATSAAGNPSSVTLSGSIRKTSEGLSDIHEAAIKMERTSRDLIGELERWNLLWGQPPADNKNAGMLWGGGLTREEVMTSFRYLPTLTFTSPDYVKFFSYRLPPRKKFLVIYTRQLGIEINMLAKALNATEAPEVQSSDWTTDWNQVQDLSRDVAARYINLMNLVDNTNDDRLKKDIRADQLTFGEPMAAIYSDVQKLGTLVKQLNGSIKRPEKSAEKAS